MKISVVGLGYVGLPLALLLSKNHNVVGVDTDEKKLATLRDKKAWFREEAMLPLIEDNSVNFVSAFDKKSAYTNAEVIFIAVPTNYDEEKNVLDTSIINSVINDILSVNKNAVIVIKSTVPSGFTSDARKAFKHQSIYFSPEFSSEGQAIHDCYFPSRIIVGGNDKNAEKIAGLLLEICKKDNVEIIHMDNTEAEAVKLFSNTYLAMRVAFFNELDSFAECKSLSAKDLIRGVCADPRIGNFYNNPSFGYGGYCLPKDSKQISAVFADVPNEIIKAIVKSNDVRKKFIADSVCAKNPQTVGIYRMQAKADSDNLRRSAVLGVIEELKKQNANIIIYEPLLESDSFEEVPVIADLQEFKSKSSIIICNRYASELDDVRQKVYTRDISGEC